MLGRNSEDDDMQEASMSRAWPGLGALIRALVATTAGAQGAAAPAPRTADPALAQAAAEAKAKLREKHGPDDGARIDRGVDQVARYWRPEDGDAKAFAAFVEAEFVPGGEPLDATFGRFEFALERVNGYFTSLIRDLRSFADLDRGPLLPLDRRLAGYNPAAHVSEDMFETKLAFVALLNFPLTRLEERLAQGGTWSRRQWAETRLAHQFASRVPAEVNAATAQAYADADAYIADYNIHMHHLLTADGKRLFPEGLRLITHWNLRDELKARYGDPEGLAKQRMIARVMDRIVTQTIPAAVIDNPLLDWNPETNAVTASPVKDGTAAPGRPATPSSEREDDERYRVWRAVYLAERQADAYSPENTFIARRFNMNRELPEKDVRALLEAVLTSPLGPEVGRLVSARLKRPLEPFDIWYAGFKPRSKHSEDELDALTRKRYPTPEAYAADIPRLLKDLGFSEEKAQFLAEHIVVDPSRGAGHAFGAARRDDKAHLRTRVGASGMDYKGYNIAVHEMGHNVEQVFSLTTIDHTLLSGVPNNAFTEALAFVFQARDLPLLGLGAPDAEAERLRALDTFWATREIAGVGLVDMDAWQWLYANPEATPAQFREAVVRIAKEVWNRHYAPIFGVRDVPLLAIYSHMVASGLYTPDYPLGHLIAFQIEDHFRRANKPLGEEFERVTRIGALTPDAWMRQAVGAPVSAKPLLDAARRALDAQKAPASR
jgi:hypothetical protein